MRAYGAIVGSVAAALAIAAPHGLAAAAGAVTGDPVISTETAPTDTTPTGATTPTDVTATTPADAMATTPDPFAPKPAESERCFGAASRDSRTSCRNRKLDRMVVPVPFEAAIEPSEPCIPMQGVGPGIEACTFGAPRREATGTVALLGDSHATHWRAALARVAASEGLRGISITRSGCPMTLATSRGGGRCARWAERVIAWRHRHPEVTAVVTSASTGSRVVPDPGTTELATAMRGYQDAWTAMPRSVRDLYVIRDVPHMSWETLGCVTDAADQGREAGRRCARPRSMALPPDPAAKAQRRSAIPRQHLIDLTAFMCDTRWCFPVVGGALVSKDAGHLTRTFSLTLGPYLQRSMAAAALLERRRNDDAARVGAATP